MYQNLILFSYQVARARELTAWAREALRLAEADDEQKDEVALKVFEDTFLISEKKLLKVLDGTFLISILF